MKWEIRKAWDGSCEWQVYELGELGGLRSRKWEGKWMVAWGPSDRPWIAENIDSESAAKTLVQGSDRACDSAARQRAGGG